MTRLPRLIAGLVAVILAFAAPSHAQDVQRIAAIVNDDIISVYDVNARIQLVMISSRLPNTTETRRRLAPQVLRALVDESLRMQEAKKRNISVTKRDFDRAKRTLEEQNNLAEGGFDDFMRQNGIPVDTANAQIRASVAWAKLVRRRLRPRIDVGEDEVDERLAALRQRQGQPEIRLAEIFLAVDSPDQEGDVRRTASRLVQQVRSGARFSALARQFSQSATAAVGGDLGWALEADLPESLREVAPKLNKNAISDPIREVAGYRVVLKIDSRRFAEADPDNAQVDLRQIFVSQTGDAGAARARQISAGLAGCDAMPAAAEAAGSDRPVELGKFRSRDLSPLIKNAINNLPVGQPSQPVTLPDGLLILMVCSRDSGAAQLPDRDTIRDQMVGERLENLARRYMRDIRLAAIVDVRV